MMVTIIIYYNNDDDDDHYDDDDDDDDNNNFTITCPGPPSPPNEPKAPNKNRTRHIVTDVFVVFCPRFAYDPHRNFWNNFLDLT